MENNYNLLIVVDPGHGGYDNGASFEGRLEKEDNLRLGLLVRDELLRLGMNVLMTRSDDTFIPLSERADMANDANANLFVSLHRNSYIEQTPLTNGVENFIYLTAPEETTGRAAGLVLENVVNVGVQNNRGVKRGDYYVLRKTRMPAMLLEMGYIINELDNQLFDKKLHEYAKAIAMGVQEYFHTDRMPCPDIVNPGVPALAPSPVGPEAFQPEVQSYAPDKISRAQNALNTTFGTGIAVDGSYGPMTKKAIIRALQNELNVTYNAGLNTDGVLGARTLSAIPQFGQNSHGKLVYLLQILLLLNGYDPGNVDGIYGSKTRAAVQMLQRDNYLSPNGIASPRVFSVLFA